MSINFEDSLSVNCAGNTIPEDPDDCDIEPHDMLAGTMLDILVVRYNPNGWCDCEIDPIDMLAEPLTDIPAIVHFSVPGRGLRSDGYAQAKNLTAHLEYTPALDKFYYRITGNTFPSRRLLRSIGCIYNKARSFWMCWDYATLEPYVVPDRNTK